MNKYVASLCVLAVASASVIPIRIQIPSGTVSVSKDGALVAGPAGSVATDNGLGGHGAGSRISGPAGDVRTRGGHTQLIGPGTGGDDGQWGGDESDDGQWQGEGGWAGEGQLNGGGNQGDDGQWGGDNEGQWNGEGSWDDGDDGQWRGEGQGSIGVVAPIAPVIVAPVAPIAAWGVQGHGW